MKLRRKQLFLDQIVVQVPHGAQYTARILKGLTNTNNSQIWIQNGSQYKKNLGENQIVAPRSKKNRGG